MAPLSIWKTRRPGALTSLSENEIHWSIRAVSLGLEPRRVLLGASEMTRERKLVAYSRERDKGRRNAQRNSLLST